MQFDGISDRHPAIWSGLLPPDTTGAVGPNHYVLAVNSGVSRLGPRGHGLTATIPFSTLFGTLTGSAARRTTAIRSCWVRPAADRWLISQFCTVADPNNHQLIAISKTADPTGAYYPVRLPDAEQQVQRLPEVRSLVVTCA